MQTICYIHGAGASPLSFSAMAAKFPDHDRWLFSYHVDEAVGDIVARFLTEVARYTHPVMVVGHSLGGIIATLVAAATPISRIATLNAPFGGVGMLDIIGFFRSEPFFHDLRSHGPILTAARTNRCSKPHIAIVGTQGLPTSREANDGVVTVASQTAKSGITYYSINLNHFEVLLSDQVAAQLARFLFAP